MTRRDFITSDDVSTDEQVALLDAADRYKAERRPLSTLAGRTVAMIFEKPSTRTRVSFEVAVHELGGYPLPLAGADLQIGRGETIEDTAVVLSRYVHAIVMRTFAQENLERMARASSVPVVNALSDYAHPCQALADLQTIRERRKQLEGLRLAYLGDGNNVCHSLLIAGTKVGMHLAVATPAGYEPIPQVVRRRRDRRRDRRQRRADPGPQGGRQGRGRALHRRVGVDGPGAGARRARPDLQALPAFDRHRGGGLRRRRGPALPARPPRRG